MQNTENTCNGIWGIKTWGSYVEHYTTDLEKKSIQARMKAGERRDNLGSFI